MMLGGKSQYYTVQAGETILEVGFGKGLSMEVAIQKLTKAGGGTIVGVDPS